MLLYFIQWFIETMIIILNKYIVNYSLGLINMNENINIFKISLNLINSAFLIIEHLNNVFPDPSILSALVSSPKIDKPRQTASIVVGQIYLFG